MSKTELTRHEIREKALQALFPLDFNADLTKQDAIDYALAYDNREIVSEDGEDLVPTYLDLLVGGVCSRKAELDEVITNHLGNNWSMQRLAKIDIVILRLAIFEMLYVSDVPNMPVVGGPVDLVFVEPWSSSTHLVFVCCKVGPNPEPPRYVIPLLRVYMTVHSIDAVLLPSLERVPLQSLSITTNDDDYGWTMSASGKLSLLDQLAPRQGVPQQIRVTIDGIQWVFAVDPPARTRKFAEHAVQVTGRSVTSLLAGPYFPSTDWANTMPRTAQQLVLEALDLTGVTLDWQLDDWLVPANIWSHSGTPLSVAQRIAEAAGGVVRSHRFEPQLQIAPRFPHMPWAWSDTVADVRMPAQIITSDSLQATRFARHNAVYVAGTGQGLPLGHVVRAGTAGDRLAPQVTDALITDTVAARLRGQSVLAASVITHQQPITVPLLTGGTNPGLILPGYLIEVQEPAEAWRGLVRGITVSVDAPTVRQTLDVERSMA